MLPEVERAASHMAGWSRAWGIAGGWALDLWRGEVSREHHDVDVAVLRDDQLALRAHLAGWQWNVIDRRAARPWLDGDPLTPPLHELVAARDGETIEVLLNDRVGDDWAFRRNPAVRRELRHAFVETACRVPVLAPEIVLLYKAKQPRTIDEADFRVHAPHLPAPSRRWLAEALATAHPQHPWLAALT